MTLNEQPKTALPSLRRPSALPVPRALASRYAVAWSESLDGAMHGDETWALLCRYRAKLLLADVSHGTDRNEELKRRIRHWERAEMDDLVLRVVGQQIVSSSR